MHVMQFMLELHMRGLYLTSLAAAGIHYRLLICHQSVCCYNIWHRRRENECMLVMRLAGKSSVALHSLQTLVDEASRQQQRAQRDSLTTMGS